MTKLIRALFIAALATVLWLWWIEPPEQGGEAPSIDTAQIPDQRLQVPDGYEVSVWAEGIDDARTMRLSPGGSMVVSQPKRGLVTLLLGDQDGDGVSDGKRVLVANLERPHGIDFYEGHLYIAELGAITRVAFKETGPDSLEITSEPERFIKDIPRGGNHWRRTIRFGPDGGLYLTIGSSCNVCEEDEPRRAVMLRYEADGTGETIYASGLRNTIGFDWQPGTNILYGTDNGRDRLGDNYPACELNRIDRGGFYGWPYAVSNLQGDTEADPDMGGGREAEIANTIAPVHAFRAHNAPLGITFVRNTDAHPDYADAALVALHGSWNRSEKDGYKVVSLHWDSAGKITERPFLTGFLLDGDVMGRPAAIVEGPGAAFYISDDYGGTVYRVAKIKETSGH
jgi:glucose/arabinose dehydrogenase